MLLNVSDSYLPHNLLITVSTYVLKVWSTVVSGIFFQANTHSDGFETGAIHACPCKARTMNFSCFTMIFRCVPTSGVLCCEKKMCISKDDEIGLRQSRVCARACAHVLGCAHVRVAGSRVR